MESTVHGNYFDKYESRNPLVRWMTRSFRRSWMDLMDQTGLMNRSFNLLEVGCGDGAHLAWFYRKTNHKGSAVAMDLGFDVVADGNQRFPELTFFNGSIYHLPFEADTFDVVTVPEVFEHLDDPHAGLKEVARVSSRFVLASVPWEPVWRMANVLRGAYVTRLGNTPGHVQHFSRRDFVRFMGSETRLTAMRRPFPWTMILAEKELTQ